MTPSWTETGHPDVDLLADLAEDLVPPVEQQPLYAHLTGCPECTDTYAALAEVRELLGTIETAPPLPDEVAARIDAALAAEAAAPVTRATDPTAPLTRRPAGPTRSARSPGSARRGRMLLATAACLAVLGLGGTLLAQQQSSTNRKASGSMADSRQEIQTAAGTQVFSEAELTEQINSLVQRGTAAAPAISGQLPSKAPSLGAAPNEEQPPAPAPSPTSPCPAIAADGLLAATPGRFGHESVTALVLPLPADRLDVYLVTADCRVLLHRAVPSSDR